MKFTLRAPKLFVLVLAVLVPISAEAQAPEPEASKGEQSEVRLNGLPSRIEWTFNFDAGWGSFGFANSLYNNPKEGVNEDLSDQWFESYIRPAVSGRYRLASSSEVYGKLSLVGERTYGSAPELYGPDVSSFSPEDAYIGWRSGKSIGSTDNLLDFSIGRAQYRLGYGFLLMDGASEGGSRGGYWTNARKAFEFATVARLKPAPHTAELFYLDKDELPDNDSGTRLWGANYELSLGEQSIVGATYLRFFAHQDMRPERNGLDVFNVRTFASPLSKVPDLRVEFEYASERNGDALDSNAWTMLGSYQLSSVRWKPKLSYRYAYFQGDDPETPANEGFDPLLLGFHDWGSWWQGEIAGEYFLSNSNLISHQVRAHVAPTEAISGGLIFYQFFLDQPQAAGPTVTAKDVAFESNLYVDWKMNRNITLSTVLAFGNPGKAAEQVSGRTKNFSYGMVYLGYSF